ncbi:Type I inositol 1,4,5-trisphosphate 5-phosphatase, partial [Armadillidium vulgare]
MENVEEFLRNILNMAAMLDFTKIRIFIDEEYTSAEKFTALGSLYFLREDVKDAQIWNFKEKKFVNVDGKEHYVGNIEDVPIKEKSKFPQEFFPECKWSRKGFLRTRWCLNGTQFDLVNIHLFHDASNFIAMEKFPSVYTLNRKRAMEHTLDRFHNDELENVPIFLFGDFNFRLDTGGVVQKLTEECQMLENVEDTGEKTSEPFDKELSEFSPRLLEFPITFPPSYPFEEGAESKDKDNGGAYMKTRCPSWCDRVILSQSAKDLIDQESKEVYYDIIGLESRMGDHKPVGLCVHMPMGAGIVRCCQKDTHCPNFVHEPLSSCFVVGSWCRCEASTLCPVVPPNSGIPPVVACPVYSNTNNNICQINGKQMSPAINSYKPVLCSSAPSNVQKKALIIESSNTITTTITPDLNHYHYDVTKDDVSIILF